MSFVYVLDVVSHFSNSLIYRNLQIDVNFEAILRKSRGSKLDRLAILIWILSGHPSPITPIRFIEMFGQESKSYRSNSIPLKTSPDSLGTTFRHRPALPTETSTSSQVPLYRPLFHTTSPEDIYNSQRVSSIWLDFGLLVIILGEYAPRVFEHIHRN